MCFTPCATQSKVVYLVAEFAHGEVSHIVVGRWISDLAHMQIAGDPKTIFVVTLSEHQGDLGVNGFSASAAPFLPREKNTSELTLPSC